MNGQINHAGTPRWLKKPPFQSLYVDIGSINGVLRIYGFCLMAFLRQISHCRPPNFGVFKGAIVNNTMLNVVICAEGMDLCFRCLEFWSLGGWEDFYSFLRNSETPNLPEAKAIIKGYPHLHSREQRGRRASD